MSEQRLVDQWADWLKRGRQQGLTAVQVRRMTRQLYKLRDRVLAGARLRASQRVLDAGAGTGLLALEARRRVHPDGVVYALDISLDALQAIRAEGGSGSPTLVAGDVTRLPFCDRAFDAVLLRSVLIYVDDKTAAVREIARVLCPGGRVSLFEPINSASLKYGYAGGVDVRELQPEVDRVRAYQSDRWPHRAAMLDFDERDLVRWFVEAGFAVEACYEHREGSKLPPPREQQARAIAEMRSALNRRPNPTMLSDAEAANAVLGEKAEEFLDRYAMLLVTQPAKSASGVLYLSGQLLPL